MKPLVSVVIPTYNRKNGIVRLIRSILKSDYPKNKLEIVVVDDLSTDGTYDKIRKLFPNVKLIRNGKKRFCTGCRNVGIINSKGDYIFLIDDDNIVDKNTIANLVSFLEVNPNVIASPVMLYVSSPNIIWCAGAKINRLTYQPYYLFHKKNINKVILSEIIKCDYNPNAYIISKKIFEKVGFFDEKSFPFCWEEIDFVLRGRKFGFQAKTISSSRVWHDVPIDVLRNDFFHIRPFRSYYRGRSRTIFYKKYAKWRLSLIFLDFAFFAFFILVANHNLKNKWFIIKCYFDGILDGLFLKKDRGVKLVK